MKVIVETFSLKEKESKRQDINSKQYESCEGI